MERIIRIAVAFGIMTITSIVAILLASGELTWKTTGLVIFLVAIAGFIAGVWAVVHGRFDRQVEIGLTLGIATVAIIGVVILLFAGASVREGIAALFRDNSPWWLLPPAVGTVIMTFVFGLHRRR